MSSTDLLFLQALRASLLSEPAKLPQSIAPEEWEALFLLASAQNVEPLIYESCAAALRASAPEDLYSCIRSRVRQAIRRQTQKTAAFYALLEYLGKYGLIPVVVKGVAVRSLYPKPDSRPSGDEDLLIGAEEFDTYHAAFLDYGLRPVTERADYTKEFEVGYAMPDGSLYIELHKQFFAPESESYGDLNRYFADAAERKELLLPFAYTLHPTDHILYLLFHALKHFMHGGVGIRQVCDISLFANVYGARIDWDYILKCCRQERADRFAAALFAVGEKYLTLDPDAAHLPDSWRALIAASQEAALLSDMLAAGVFGASSRSRLHSSRITLDAVAAGRQGQKAGRGRLQSAVFPPAEALSEKYTYLKKHPVLLPAAWLQRIAGYLKETGNGDSRERAADAVRIGRERVRLLRQYGVID